MEHHHISSTKVSRETFQDIHKLWESHETTLDLYLDQLLWWNKRVNLVSRNVSRETVAEHLRHSLLVNSLSVYQSASSIVDAGTGGGLPGIPLAITSPGKNFILNDIVSKKCLAIKQMLRKLELTNAQVNDGSIENVQSPSPFLFITKHAFKINDLLSLTHHLPWTAMILYKGLPFEDELAGISTPLSIKVHDLSNGSDFYQDKALLVVRR